MKQLFSIIFVVCFTFVCISCVSEDDTPGEENDETAHIDDNNNETNVATCGNNILDENEVCDSSAISCIELNSKYSGGIATCKDDCSGYDRSSCQEDTGGSSSSGSSGGSSGGSSSGSGANFDKNSDGIWYDPDTSLIWEEPMMHQGMGGFGPTHQVSKDYCDNLVLAGTDDWRLPTISELRTLVRGVSTTATDGICPTTDSCTNQGECHDDDDNTNGFGYSCLGCQSKDPKYDQSTTYLSSDDCQLTEKDIENGVCYRTPFLSGPCDGTWSDTPNTGGAGTAANAFWYLNFKRGLINSDADILSGANWVRCVRAGTTEDAPDNPPEEPPVHYGECMTDNHCEEDYYCVENQCIVKPEPTWIDPDTGFSWQTDSQNSMTWEAAIAYCENLELGGHSDWHLPDVSELKSLVKGCSETPKCGITAECNGFTACDGGSDACKKGCTRDNYLPEYLGVDNFSYWSASQEAQTPKNAWIINFAVGTITYIDKNWDNQYVRCISN